jgi:hypothetical protein
VPPPTEPAACARITNRPTNTPFACALVIVVKDAATVEIALPTAADPTAEELPPLPSVVTAAETDAVTAAGTAEAVITPATAAPAAAPFVADGAVIAAAIAAPAAGGTETEIEPPPLVETVTVPDDRPAATVAGAGGVTVPEAFPVVATAGAPGAAGADVVPLCVPAGAPAVAFGVLAVGVGLGENVPPAAPDPDPVFGPLLSDPLLVGATLKWGRKPPSFCAAAGAHATAIIRALETAPRATFDVIILI